MSETVQGFIRETSDLFKRDQYLSTLDLELMACNLLNIERSKLFSSSVCLDSKQQTEFLSMIKRRNSGEPLAYILGTKGFWNLDLVVNRNVLVPRPETEILVEDILFNFNKAHLNVLDLGTGSGAIGLSLKEERKSWEVYCSDLSKTALKVAKKNSIKYGLDTKFICCDWLNAFKAESFDLIISNPPYIEKGNTSLESEGLRFEPYEALVSGTTGKEHLFYIASSASRYLKKGGYLYLEHSPLQAKDLTLFLKKKKFKNISEIFDLNGDKRAIKAQNF